MIGHLRVHSMERLLNCPQCHKSIAQKTSLQGYIRIDTREKLVGCPECSKVFSKKCNLLRHLVVHTFCCSVCLKSIAQKLYCKIIWEFTLKRNSLADQRVQKYFTKHLIYLDIWYPLIGGKILPKISFEKNRYNSCIPCSCRPIF